MLWLAFVVSFGLQFSEEGAFAKEYLMFNYKSVK
jgi:hypothetical protein